MILVTGKSGVGKTTILKMSGFKNIHFMDNIVKNKFYKRGQPLYKEIKKVFGFKCVDFLKVNTKELGKIVFSSKTKLSKLNKIVKPYVQKYLEKLKNDPYNLHIIEMGAYINNEKDYKNYFDHVILITRKNPDLKMKFNYLDKKSNPISDKKIKYDFLINNENLNFSRKTFLKIINEI